MKLFLMFVLVLLALKLSECIVTPGEEPAQSGIWPYVKNGFSYPTQSPVNINSDDVQGRELSSLNIYFPWYSTKEIVRIENTGYYLEVLLPEEVEDRPYVTGGPLLNEKYIFEQFHFHWGKTDKCGSEHRINGKCFSDEVHSVFYNEKYGSLDAAVEHPDGVAVVAVFGERNSKNTDNPDLKSLVTKLSKVIQPRTNTASSFKTEFKFLKDIIQQQSYYFAYPGSLTTPPFFECVTFIIFPEPFDISSKQLEAFRKLIASDGEKLKENDRPLQEFNNRPLLILNYYPD